MIRSASDESLVLFLERFSSATEIFRDGGAVAFVNELHQRWTERHPDRRRRPPPAPPPDGVRGRRRNQGPCF